MNELLKKETIKIKNVAEKKSAVLGYLIKIKSHEEINAFFKKLFDEPETIPIAELREIFKVADLDESVIKRKLETTNISNELSEIKYEIDSLILKLLELKERIANIGG